MHVPKTIREQVTSAIRDQLVAGEFEAGAVLRETQFAERMGVSRGPIRDAFLQLSQEGFLAYQANRGVTVRHPPNPEHRALIVELRVQIEGFFIEQGLADITEEGLKVIEARLVDLQRACSADDIPRIASSDIAFHEAILVACGGADMSQAWRQLCALMLLAYTRLHGADEVYEEHLAIFNAVKNGSVEKAIVALKNNIR